MAERISGAALTLAFNKRANSELGVLHEKLEVQLREDISKVYTESLYTDLEITFASGRIHTHSYVLKSRAPRFYSELSSIQYKLPPVVNIQIIESFVRDIYTKNVITEKENDLVAYLSKLNKVCRHPIDVCTPESDVYLTPETSPTDIKHRYGHTRCASDSGINNLSDSSANLRKTNTLYYSLVTVDEVFDSFTNETEAVLERELAEQDELFKSFKSIISKEVKNCNRSKGNKPSKFTLPFSPKQRQKFPIVQTKSLNKAACLDFKFDLDTTIKERYSQKLFVTTNNKIEKLNINNLNEQIKSSKTLKPVEFSNVVENDLKVSDSHFNINNDKKCLQEDVQTKQIEAMSKQQKLEVDEVMSNPEIDVQGQDSCLEAGSSGYLTGSSPKDQTVSETSNADVTEVATSDDIPHDNDPSVQSSSVSSDGGTWDSTFPNSTTIEDSVINQDSALHRNDTKTDKLQSFENTKALNNTVAVSVHSGKKICIDNIFNADNNLEAHYPNTLHTVKQGAFPLREIDSPQRDKDYFTTQTLKTNYLEDDGVNFLEKNLSYNLHSHSSEWNSPNVIDNPEANETKLNKSFSDQEDCDHETFARHSEEQFELLDKNELESNSAVCKTNCFIDASSLSDESEVPVPIPRISHRENVYYDLLEEVVNSSSDTENVSKQDKSNLVCNKNEFRTSRKRDNESVPSANNSPVYNGISKCDGDSSDPNFISRESSLNFTYSGTTIEQNNTTVDDKSKQIGTDFENRRASLIRRNTFELEPDDEKLAMLRQEYEKRQGNLIFKSCSQSSNNSDSNSEIDNNVSSIDIHSKESFQLSKQEPPDTLVLQKNPHIRPLADDEAQSPDSLNNDGPIDNPFHNKIQKQVKSTDAINLEDLDDFESKYVIENPIVQSIDENNHSKCNSSDFEDINHYTFENQSSDVPSMLSNKSNSLNSYSLNENPSLENKIESMPIVSGGASLSDFPINKETSASPLMNRRKTEFTPIVSGGSVALPTPEPELKPKPSSSLTTSWVVDMSDTVKSPPEARKKKRSNSVLSTASSDHCEFEDNMSKSTSRMNNSAMGFFIPLDDPFDEKSSSESGYKSMTPQMPRSLKSKDIGSSLSNETMVASNVSNSSCGFYIDLKGEQESNKQASTSSLTDNKLFTMFIDLGETGSVKSSENLSPKTKTGSPHLLSKKNRPAKTHTERFTSKHFAEVLPSEDHQSLESNPDISEHPEVTKAKLMFTNSTPPPSRQISHTDDSTSDLTDSGSKKSFYMFIEADASPVPRRRTLPSGLRPNIQRHSWNPDSLNAATTESTQTEMPKKNHRRAHSVSVDKSLEIMFNVSQAEKKMSSTSSIIKNSNSNSIGYESGPSSIDEHVPRSLDKNNKLMMASWHGSIKPSSELQKVIARSERRDCKDSKSILAMFRTNEIKSFDSCSEDKGDFDRYEETVSMKSDDMFDLSNVSEVSSHRDIHNSTFVLDVSNVANATSNEMDLSTPSHDVVSELSKDDSDPTETDFVQAFNRERKLDSRTVTIDSKHMRDRDTPITPDHSASQPLISVPEESKSSFVKLSDMDKEPARIVVEEKRIVNRMSRSIPEASWIESKMMTRSATSRSLSRLFPHLHTVTRNRTPDSAEQDTDVSEMSSLQSSMEPSALEGSTEETDASSCTSGPCSRLGEDLLRMFLDEISPDVTVEVGGRRIKAHKCILSSRCQYFAAILSGGWVESAGNVISLQGFSYNAVHFALCHIYSGTSNIPDSINIVELATLADMLCLEGLKEIIMYTLKVKYCHFFHKPCQMCTVGVLECLPLAAAYGLDEIYRKSLRWITKYFVRVWPTKGFATLPRELLEKCYKQHIVHMSVDNVLETILCCGKLQSTIPAVRWAEPVITLTTRLHDSAVKYIAQHFCGILSNEMFLALGKEDLWNVSRLEEALSTAADKLPPDQACKCHSRLYNILMVIDRPDPPPEMQWSQTFVQLLQRLSAVVENCLIKQAARAARTPAWSLMEPHLRHKIQDAACLVIVPGDERRRARHSSLLRRNESSTRTGDLQQVKVAITQQAVTTTRKPTSSATNTTTTVRTTSAQSKVQPASSAATKTEESGPRPKTWPYKMAEVKSRYLEQRTVKTQPTVRDKPSGSVPVTRRTVTKSIISSSDSSRTSSPAMKPLNTRPSRSLSNKESNLRPKCDDGISMSTDSLAESTMSKPSIIGNKTLIKKKADTEVNRSQVRTPLLDKTRRILPNRIDGIKNKSTESLTKTKSQGNGFQPTLNKDSNKSKSSPIPLSKKSSSQSSPGVRDSPVVGRVKTTVASSPSPSLKRNTFSPKNPPEVKSSLLKRTSTYRVQTKSSVNQTKSTPVKTPVTSNIKNCNNNRVQNKLSTQPAKLTTNNNFPQQISDTNKTEITPKPMVGSRSGTFLKDEPTVLKKPQVTNVIE